MVAYWGHYDDWNKLLLFYVYSIPLSRNPKIPTRNFALRRGIRSSCNLGEAFILSLAHFSTRKSRRIKISGNWPVVKSWVSIPNCGDNGLFLPQTSQVNDGSLSQTLWLWGEALEISDQRSGWILGLEHACPWMCADNTQSTLNHYKNRSNLESTSMIWYHVRKLGSLKLPRKSTAPNLFKTSHKHRSKSTPHKKKFLQQWDKPCTRAPSLVSNTTIIVLRVNKQAEIQ